MYEPSINQGTVDFRSLHEELNRFNDDCSGYYAPTAVEWLGSKLDWFDEADNMYNIPLDLSHDVTTVRVDPDSTDQYSTAKQLFIRTSVSHQLTQREILCATSDDEDYHSIPIATTPSPERRRVLMLRRATAGNKIPSSPKQVPESDLPANAARAMLGRSYK